MRVFYGDGFIWVRHAERGRFGFIQGDQDVIKICPAWPGEVGLLNIGRPLRPNARPGSEPESLPIVYQESQEHHFGLVTSDSHGPPRRKVSKRWPNLQTEAHYEGF